MISIPYTVSKVGQWFIKTKGSKVRVSSQHEELHEYQPTPVYWARPIVRVSPSLFTT